VDILEKLSIALEASAVDLFAQRRR
jgi:hypothetical protein